MSVPEWWMDELRAEMRRRGWKQARLAQEMAETDDRESAAFAAAKTRISRFLRGTFQSEETVQELRRLLGLPVFHIVLRSRDEADTLVEAQREGASSVRGAMAMARLLEQIRSGEAELDEMLSRGHSTSRDTSRNEQPVGPSRPSRAGRSTRSD